MPWVSHPWQNGQWNTLRPNRSARPSTGYGSSTCPVVPTELRVTAEAGEGNAVEAALPELPDGPCTMDFTPHTTVFSTPADVTTTEPLEVTVGEQTVTGPIK